MGKGLEKTPAVSVIIAIRGDEPHVGRCLRSVLDGTLPEDDIEIIVADGGSSDHALRSLKEVAAGHLCIRVIDNPKRITPAGFNEAIKASTGRAICILSAHCYVDPDYLETCLAGLDSQCADVVGGVMVTLPGSDSAQARMIQAITSSRFGMGSSFRTIRRDGPVDTVVFGVYRREVFERIGLFDERLVRNQDNELNSRLRASGGKVWLASQTASYYFGRQSLRRLGVQNFRNGMYGILTWRITPASFAVRHAVPMMFVLFVMGGGLISLVWPAAAYAYLGALGLYATMGIAAGVSTALRTRDPLAMLLPFAFVVLHVVYGLGSLVGICRFGATRLAGPGPEKLQPMRQDTQC